MSPSSGRLRDRRREVGLTQAQLAQRAGVSRQLIAAVEAGRNVPGVDAALRIAAALATTVEALFAASSPNPVAALGEDLPNGVPLRLGRVGERLVGGELADHGAAGAAWAMADGVLEDGRLRVLPGAGLDGLVVAGCDPALGVAEAMLGGLGARSLRVLWAATGAALTALSRGRVHAALVHGPEGWLPDPPVPVRRWHLARWQVGVAVAAGAGTASLPAVLQSGMAVVQRDRAAASQQALDRAVRRLGAAPPAGPRASGHIDAARRAALAGCAAVTTEAAAYAFGLRFCPLERHTVEVWLAEDWADHPGVEGLGNVLAGAAFTDRVRLFGGYDLLDCGTPI